MTIFRLGRSASRRLKALAWLPLPLALAACPPAPTRIDATDASCVAFRPITYDDRPGRDTPETVAQVQDHNAAWDKLCKKPPAAP